jgi:MFS family permease
MVDTNDAYHTPQTITLLAVFVLALAASFYMYEFILQVSVGVMTGDLMRDLSIDAAGIGAMSAFYYLAYTPMQLPAGLLYDRFGPRILLTIAVAVCAIGAFLFSIAHGFLPVAFGRFFMGVGSAFSFIGSLVLLTRWFPARYFAVLAGLVQLMSSIGAIAGEAPLAAAIQHFGWRGTILALALVGFALALVIWLVVRDSPVKNQPRPADHRRMSEWSRLKLVCKHPQTWLLGLYSFCSWAPILVFAALWGVPFLVIAYGMSTTEASFLCSMIWIGIGIGSPLIGIWSEQIGRRCYPLFVSALIGLIAMGAVLYIPHLPVFLLYIALFVVGLSASGQSLSFALVRDNNPNETVGTAIGFNNMLVVAGGILFQPLVGIILRLLWDGTVENGVPVYQIGHYQIAMLVVPLCYIVGMLMAGKFLHETHCKLYRERMGS